MLLRKFIYLICLTSLSAAAALAKEEPSNLTNELKTFLGPAPKFFEERYHQPAKKLKQALLHEQDGKIDLAIKDLLPLSEKSEFADHATYQLIQLYRSKKEFSKSNAQILRLLYELPYSSYADNTKDLILANDCDKALTTARAANNAIKKKAAAQNLLLCLSKSPWKDWPNKEAQVEALFFIFKENKDPLLGPFTAEVIQAMPAGSDIRKKINKAIPNSELKKYSELARYRMKTNPPAGIKAVYPDSDLFDQGMAFVLQNKWGEANSVFKKLTNDYPQSEHLDRAQYWIARTEDLLGNQEEAKRRYEQILSDSPLTYYGLQSALRLKRDLQTYVLPSEIKLKPMEGTLLTRQAISIWKLRALIEVGLIDQAREEAEFLFQHRPGGFTFGQDSPEGAILTAYLYQSAGFHLAAFSQAATAISFDINNLNTFTLDLIFPQVFREEILRAGEQTTINPLLIYSLTKQESAFLPNALSRSDAMGLMQLLFGTAREIDSKVNKTDLFKPATNTILGAKYLKKLIDRYQGNIALALAAYNAGPTRANQWQKKLLESSNMKQNFDIEIFIDTIPFAETRKYVSNILRNFAWYKLLNKDGTLSSIQELAFQWQKEKVITNPPPATDPVPESNPQPTQPEPMPDPLPEQPDPAAATPAPTPTPTADPTTT